jgi:hypothetical protein
MVPAAPGLLPPGIAFVFAPPEPQAVRANVRRRLSQGNALRAGEEATGALGLKGFSKNAKNHDGSWSIAVREVLAMILFRINHAWDKAFQ